MTREKYQLMAETVFAAYEYEEGILLEELRAISRSVGITQPIGWLMGFANFLLSPNDLNQNPYPHLSLAYVHFERGRMCARTYYEQFYF
jgi:hypothetical protein